jgi:hypothetical protein
VFRLPRGPPALAPAPAHDRVFVQLQITTCLPSRTPGARATSRALDDQSRDRSPWSAWKTDGGFHFAKKTSSYYQATLPNSSTWRPSKPKPRTKTARSCSASCAASQPRTGSTLRCVRPRSGWRVWAAVGATCAALPYSARVSCSGAT